MKWTHVKTLLIAMLIIVDVFIGIQLYFNKASKEKMSTDTFETAKQVLAERGLKISGNVENAYSELGAVKFNDIDTSISLAAQLLLGKCTLEADENGKRLSNGISYIKYDSLGNIEYINNEIENVPASAAEAQRHASRFFSDIGLPPTYYELGQVTEGIQQTVITVKQMIDQTPVIGAQLELTVCRDGIKAAKGIWFFGTLEFMSASERDMLNMLFAIADFYKGRKVTMENAQQGYYRMYNTIEREIESIVLGCAWRVETDISNIIFSSVTGQIVFVEEKQGD